MKKSKLSFFFLSTSLFLTTACNGQGNKNSKNDNSDSSTNSYRIIKRVLPNSQAELQSFLDAGIDPYFVDTEDTVSTHGPQCIVRDLMIDKNGSIWLATWMGIIKYDGHVFTNYTLKYGLIKFHVFSCYRDKNENLWFGTARGGIYRYDGKSFKLFTTQDGLPDNTVQCMQDDNEGNIWFGTTNGLSRYDGKGFTNFSKQEGLFSNNISSIIQDKKGKLWFGCNETKYMNRDGGVNCYDGKSFSSFPNKDGKSFQAVLSLFEDSHGNIWIGRMDGLTRYDGKDLTDLESRFSYYITQDKTGNIWLSVSEPPNENHPGLPKQILYKYDGKTFTMILEKNNPGDFQIFGKVADHSGNIWFGTMQGVARYKEKK